MSEGWWGLKFKSINTAIFYTKPVKIQETGKLPVIIDNFSLRFLDKNDSWQDSNSRPVVHRIFLVKYPNQIWPLKQGPCRFLRPASHIIWGSFKFKF